MNDTTGLPAAAGEALRKVLADRIVAAFEWNDAPDSDAERRLLIDAGIEDAWPHIVAYAETAATVKPGPRAAGALS